MSQESILVVDDEEVMRDVLGQVLGMDETEREAA